MKTPYAWAISNDHLADNDACPGTNANAYGVSGPRGNDLTAKEIFENPEAEKFRMLDDDGELYYEGFMLHGEESTGFEPLEDFGMPNAGCTEIRYKDKDGNWKGL